MVDRVLRWVQRIREQLERTREAHAQTGRELNSTIELMRNAETLVRPDTLPDIVAHDPALVRQFLEALDPWILRVAWTQLAPEKRKEIMEAEQDAKD